MHPPSLRCLTLLLALAGGTALAQQEPPPPPGAASAVATVAPQTPASSGEAVKYLSGGAGDEERSRLMAQWRQFPLLIVFSAAAGAYAVPEQVLIRNAQGAELLSVDNAGPLLMVNLPPGDYRLQARNGGAMQERRVQVSATPQRLDWRL